MAQNLTTERELRDSLTRVPANHPGAAVVTAILLDEPDLTRTRSPAERYVLPLVIAADLPRPLVNAWIEGELVDLRPFRRVIAGPARCRSSKEKA